MFPAHFTSNSQPHIANGLDLTAAVSGEHKKNTISKLKNKSY